MTGLKILWTDQKLIFLAYFLWLRWEEFCTKDFFWSLYVWNYGSKPYGYSLYEMDRKLGVLYDAWVFTQIVVYGVDASDSDSKWAFRYIIGEDQDTKIGFESDTRYAHERKALDYFHLHIQHPVMTVFSLHVKPDKKHCRDFIHDYLRAWRENRQGYDGKNIYSSDTQIGCVVKKIFEITKETSKDNFVFPILREEIDTLACLLALEQWGNLQIKSFGYTDDTKVFEDAITLRLALLDKFFDVFTQDRNEGVKFDFELMWDSELLYRVYYDGKSYLWDIEGNQMRINRWGFPLKVFTLWLDSTGVHDFTIHSLSEDLVHKPDLLKKSLNNFRRNLRKTFPRLQSSWLIFQKQDTLILDSAIFQFRENQITKK